MDTALGQWKNLLKHLRRLFPAQTPGSTNTSHTHDDVQVQQVLQALSACGLITVSNKAAHKRLVADMEVCSNRAFHHHSELHSEAMVVDGAPTDRQLEQHPEQSLTPHIQPADTVWYCLAVKYTSNHRALTAHSI